MTSRFSQLGLAVTALAATSALALGTATVPAHADHTAGKGERSDRPHESQPLVIAHRGASGYRPEHTLEAYRLAIRMGADYVEPDLVPTKDGVLVARHENEISGTTDVADRPEFADRRTTKTIDGTAVTGWFTEDFTLAELKTLRAKERLPQVRPANTLYDGRYEVPTLDEVIGLVADESRRAGRKIGIAPETKHPTYFDSIGLSMEEPLVRTLRRHGLDRRNANVVLQSFETGNLRELATMTRVPIAQLVDGSGAPYDLRASGSTTTYRDLVTPAGLAEIATYADWVAPHKNLILPRDAAGATGAPSALVDDAHAAGLRVVTWTLRLENQFMATNFRRGTDPNAPGDLVAETEAFLDAGVDALFTSHPDVGVAARDGWLAAYSRGSA
jgi:glycerophosphoryl diester phosphodiesterase